MTAEHRRPRRDRIHELARTATLRTDGVAELVEASVVAIGGTYELTISVRIAAGDPGVLAQAVQEAVMNATAQHGLLDYVGGIYVSVAEPAADDGARRSALGPGS